MANQLNRPQAVENPSQKCSTSVGSIAQLYYAAVIVRLAAIESSGLATELKLTAKFTVSGSTITRPSSILFNYIANVFLGIVIVQFTQQVQTMEHIADPLAASGARIMSVCSWFSIPHPSLYSHYYSPINGFFLEDNKFWKYNLGGVRHAAQWVAPTPHIVLSMVVGPAGMIHPGFGSALGAGANLSGSVDRLVNKR
ncbi:MAG: hypothetical protein EZS28_001601 [Streblomastix strix]|uniref:Uncharacterized protein n=1 Tax=Streblomastix strix TaxID=222440 RepID=A0A5J4X7Z9_9EUKA|nr:MAG: hypothetical protein EZS28_001601 [Streblomastix strix]